MQPLKQVAVRLHAQIAMQPLFDPWVGKEVDRHAIGLGQAGSGQYSFFCACRLFMHHGSPLDVGVTQTVNVPTDPVSVER